MAQIHYLVPNGEYQQIGYSLPHWKIDDHQKIDLIVNWVRCGMLELDDFIRYCNVITSNGNIFIFEGKVTAFDMKYTKGWYDEFDFTNYKDLFETNGFFGDYNVKFIDGKLIKV